MGQRGLPVGGKGDQLEGQHEREDEYQDVAGPVRDGRDIAGPVARPALQALAQGADDETEQSVADDGRDRHQQQMAEEGDIQPGIQLRHGVLLVDSV
ncbi:hypothetical protein D3C78_1274190 [compost metagenome]